MFTPWGIPTQTTRLDKGISVVMTTKHGGLMVSRGYAQVHLSAAAKNRATRFGEYYAYEKDRAWAIAIWELPRLWSQALVLLAPETSPDPKMYLLNILSRAYPDYLREIGVKPEL